jgi:ribose transport system substrate-binding protein
MSRYSMHAVACMLVCCAAVLSSCDNGGAGRRSAAGGSAGVQIVGFDEQKATLQGIMDGHIHGTVSQQPFNYGYQSIMVCKKLIDDDRSVIPPGGIIDMELLAVKKGNVREFWDGLDKQLAGAEDGAASPDAAAAAGDIEIAFITNGIDPFWNIAAAGARQAARELGVKVNVLMPPDGVGDQNRMIEAAITRGADAMAISPIHKSNQNGILNRACEAMPVITFDSDAPDSNRLLFLGVDNFKAGREVGKMVKQACPDGGEVMIFIGRLDQLNATQRTQGVIDELLGLPEDETALEDSTRNYSAQDIKAGKYTILAVQTDGFDKALAKQRVEDTLTAHPGVDCMVGLFAYNPPLILDAVRAADMLPR